MQFRIRALGLCSLIFAGCTGAVCGSDIADDSPSTEAGDDADDADTASSDDSGTTQADSDPTSEGDSPGTSKPLATGLTIAQIVVNQGVQIPIALSGAKVATRKADVVAGRAAIVRVYLTPKSGFSPHAVTGELTLQSSSGTTTYSSSITPSGASTDGSLGSTMNFDVPTDAIKVDTSYSVAVYDSTAGGGDTSGARHPASGAESLDARSTGEQLKIVIVPFQYNADGSGRLPDTSAAQIERYRQAFYGMYPAKKVDVTVHAPFPYSYSISASGSGFSTALNAMIKLRQSDGVSKDVYYHGVFAPTSSFASFCAGSCVTGLCGLSSSPSDSTVRACIGIGFTGQSAVDTAVQEVGHAHGREHAPCGGAAGADPSFPYPSAGIGVYGYDLTAKTLMSPSMYKDLMSYCRPYWVSDYTYQAFVRRMAFVNGAAYAFGLSEPRAYRFVDVAADGSLTWGDTVSLTETPQGDARTFVWEAADGRPAGTATGAFYRYDNVGGGFILVPESLPIAAAVRAGTVRLPRPTLR